MTTKGYFEVVGTGEFPLDMLRYDECWPYDNAASSALATPETLEGHKTPRTIRLATASKFAPTRRRWESFTWRVV